MAAFTYAARDGKGDLVQGDINASSPTEVARLLRNEGKFVVRVAPKGAATSKPHGANRSAAAANTITQATSLRPQALNPNPQTSRLKSLSNSAPGGSARGGKYKPDDLIFFTNQLAVLTETGVSLTEGLEACMHDGNSPRFARTLDEIFDKVQGGSEFSAALADHPRIFSPMYVSLIKASEASGMMGPMLRRLSNHLEAQREMSKKIKGAITYPIVMFLFAIGVTIFLMTFVLPKFTNIYNGREDKLPKITKALMVFSHWLTDYGLYLLGVLVVAAVCGWYYFWRTPNGRRQWDAIKLRLPMLGSMLHKTYLTRSLRTLGTMIGSGVSILEGIKLTSGVCGSLHYEKMWNDVNARLETGQQLSEALADNKHVPKAVNKMLAAGERTGQLGPVMERVAIFCEAELNITIKTLTSMLEPAIIMFLGTVVGGLVLALLLPIFTISKAMR